MRHGTRFAGSGTRRFGGLVAVLLILLFCGSVISFAGQQRFGGVGLQVVPVATGDLVVLSVIKDSPAGVGGLKPGDLIVQVDDFPLRGSDFSQVVSRYLWGKAGTKVTLGYFRPGEAGRHAVTLKRVSMNPEAAAPPGVKMLSPGER